MSDTITVLRSQQTQIVDAEWGQLTWNASRELGNCDDLTVGQCLLKPGQGNPRHYHPNCCEVLVVISGTVSHTRADDDEAELGPGDTVHIPVGVPHQARNLSNTEDALVFIAFSSADRLTVMVEA
jgi:quercetin dioxygenase-like cupin family protein